MKPSTRERKALSSASFHQMTTVVMMTMVGKKQNCPVSGKKTAQHTDGISAYRVYFNVPEGWNQKRYYIFHI